MASMEMIGEFPAAADATMPFITELALWAGEWQRALDVSREYLARRPTGLGAYLGYGRAASAAWALGRVALADSLAAGALAVQAAAGIPWDPAAALLNALRHRDWAAADSLCARLPRWDRCGYLHLARGRLEAAVRVLAPVAAADTGVAAWQRAAASAALAQVEVLRGRPDSAWARLEGADRQLPMRGLARAGTHLKRFLLCGAAAQLGRSSDLPGCALEGENPAAWDADPSFAVLLRSGAWSRRLLALRSLERGDAWAALVQARAAVRSNFDNPATIDHLLLALGFDALQRADSALAHYTAAARIERDVGFPGGAAVAFPLAPVYRRMGELAEAAGDVPAARRSYGAFLQLWDGADPELQQQVQAVRARVRQLQSGN